MSIEQPSVRKLLETKVVVRPVVRVMLAVVVAAGGLAFGAFGASILLLKPSAPYPHPFGVALLSVGLVALGAGFLWVGVRLLRPRADSENLLSPQVRRRCSLIVGGLGVGMVVAAFEAGNLWFFATAAGLIVFSYWLFPLERR